MTGFVYAIRSGDLVKIGWSANPFQRMSKIQSDNPANVTLLGMVEATREQEAEVHRLLAPWCHAGEWYVVSDPVKRFVELLPSPGPRAVPFTPCVDQSSFVSGRDPERTLAEWIDENIGSDAEFARRVAMLPSHLSLLLRGMRGVSTETAARIEQETGGTFTAGRLERERRRFNFSREPVEATP